MSYDKSESLVVSPLPGQLAGLQYCFSTDSPTHGAPPYRGSTHVLFHYINSLSPLLLSFLLVLALCYCQQCRTSI
jgi:hypothetical protein